MPEDNLTTVYCVVVRVEPISGSPVAAAIYQGYGEEWIKTYLQAKMPAGSPITIRSVHEAS